MTKVETKEYEHCSKCPNWDWIDGIFSFYSCRKIEEGESIIKDIWGEIPKWCPLPDKKKQDVLG